MRPFDRQFFVRRILLPLGLAESLVSSSASAAPGGGSLPWETTFGNILESFNRLSPILITIAVLVAGLTIAFGESGGMSRKVVYIVVGGAGALGIAATMSGLFGVSAGLSL